MLELSPTALMLYERGQAALPDLSGVWLALINQHFLQHHRHATTQRGRPERVVRQRVECCKSLPGRTMRRTPETASGASPRKGVQVQVLSSALEAASGFAEKPQTLFSYPRGFPIWEGRWGCRQSRRRRRSVLVSHK